VHALTVDLEEYFHVTNFEDVISPQQWDRIPSRVEDATHRLLDRFDEAGARATFFPLGWVAERKPKLLQEIARRGHEIACHGHSHRMLGDLGPKAFRADLIQARAAIEDATGTRPVGFRAPSFSITRDAAWALAVLAEEGFEYDSSIFPVRHPRYGVPDFERGIVRLELGDGRSILEYPPTTMRVGRWNVPVAGGAYLRILPPAVFRFCFRRATRSGRPGLIYVHPWEVDPEQPRVRASWPGRVIHYWNLNRTEERLVLLLRAGGFTTLADVLRHQLANGVVPTSPLDRYRMGRPLLSEGTRPTRRWSMHE
jgi:polysaccharide deacetylase family protein (PEP-CTERM system associated)